jgi:hypothetical protein
LTLAAFALVRGSVTPTYTKQRGFSGTIARAGAGNYTLTLQDGGVPQGGCIEALGLRAVLPAAGGSIAINHLSDTSKQITISLGGVLADADFSIQLSVMPV